MCGWQRFDLNSLYINLITDFTEGQDHRDLVLAAYKRVWPIAESFLKVNIIFVLLNNLLFSRTTLFIFT